MAKPSESVMEALHLLKSTDPPSWLVPSDTLSQAARTASQHLFSSLKPYVPKSPFDQLLIDGFDAEQIWQQIDLLSQPLLSNLRRQVKHLEKHPEELKMVPKEKIENEVLKEGGKATKEKECNIVDEDEMDVDEFDDDDEEEEEEEEDAEKGEEREIEEGDSEDENIGEEKGGGGIEDKFLKIKELEQYLEEDETREYGLDVKKKKDEQKNLDELEEEDDESDDDDDDDDGEEDEEDEEEFDDGDEDDELENARYEDFFGGKKAAAPKRKSKIDDDYDEETSLDDEQGAGKVNEKKGGLSTHEKHIQKLRAEIEQMEKSNLEPKAWTMQGEVTAASRPKNSALEVDLDFEHNVRPAPVITEEVTASLEDLIKNRIIEGLFDDIQKVPSLPSSAPREVKELDDNKSKKGLAEVYEEEYIQKTNPAAAPLSFSDEQKKEASVLFKKLCLKLDALSHFHFAPKPVVEDMSIQANVPALAMEEIAPMAVSDAAMLAPEEVFSGKGGIKEEAELTKEERKRRRAKKKRKSKAESVKRMAKKARETTTLPDNNDGKE